MEKMQGICFSLRAGMQGTDSFDSKEDFCHPPSKGKELPQGWINRVEGRKGKVTHQTFFFLFRAQTGF